MAIKGSDGGGKACFKKPVWTLTELARSLPSMPRHALRTLPTVMNMPISGRLRERIMLAVAAENRCRYCRIAHATFAEALDMSRGEISDIIKGSHEGLSACDAMALAYVRDLAMRDFKSKDATLRAKLHDCFTREQVNAIESSAVVMNFANRFGNTFDAALETATGGCDETGAGLLDKLVVSTVFAGAASLVSPLVGALMAVNRLRRGRD
ncbi:MAG: carboxymuconolactone decarboxylase family protein [Pseudomonadota bacterium]